MMQDKLVNNLVLDTMHEMVTDRDRTIGQVKGAIRQYLHRKEQFEHNKNYVNYTKMKEAEKRLKQIGDMNHEPRSFTR